MKIEGEGWLYFLRVHNDTKRTIEVTLKERSPGMIAIIYAIPAKSHLQIGLDNLEARKPWYVHVKPRSKIERLTKNMPVGSGSVEIKVTSPNALTLPGG